MRAKIIVLTMAIFVLFSVPVFASPVSEMVESVKVRYEKTKELIEEKLENTRGEADAKSGAFPLSFQNEDAYLKSIEEQTGQTILSVKNIAEMVRTVKEEVLYSLKNVKPQENPIVLLLASPLIIVALVLFKSASGYKNQKAINRINGKKSIFDFGDMAYSLEHNLNGFDLTNQQFMLNETNRQFMEFSMNEAMKAVTPFDHGGYVQGYGFNPSDTMAGDMQRQMDSMNDMNHMGGMGMF